MCQLKKINVPNTKVLSVYPITYTSNAEKGKVLHCAMFTTFKHIQWVSSNEYLRPLIHNKLAQCCECIWMSIWVPHFILIEESRILAILAGSQLVTADVKYTLKIWVYTSTLFYTFLSIGCNLPSWSRGMLKGCYWWWRTVITSMIYSFLPDGGDVTGMTLTMVYIKDPYGLSFRGGVIAQNACADFSCCKRVIDITIVSLNPGSRRSRSWLLIISISPKKAAKPPGSIIFSE